MAQTAVNYSCPYCNRFSTITEEDWAAGQAETRWHNPHDDLVFIAEFYQCPNPDCKKITLFGHLFKNIMYNSTTTKEYWKSQEKIKSFQLVPDSRAKVYPEYIPQQILMDYEEAVKICDLSPKASATLARRCLQGMIRDFWGINKRTLWEEINAIKNMVYPEVWQAMNAVRTLGNVGAHSEENINLIIEIEPHEADLMIRLLEMLFKEWYIQRHERQKDLQEMIITAEKKDDIRQNSSTKE